MLKKTSHILLGTTLALAIGAGAFTPAAYAANDDAQGVQKHQRGERGDHRQFGPRRGNPLFAALCGEKADDRRSEVFSRVEEKISPTGDQLTLWDDLKTTITTASTTFSENCAEPADKDTITPPEQMSHQIAMMEAKLEFSSAVLPAFESFYDSLSDDQKAEWKKRPEGRGKDGKFGRHGKRDGGNGPRGGGNS